MKGKSFLYGMKGGTNLEELIKNMQPTLQEGSYVFANVADMKLIDTGKILSFFKEQEGYTLIVEKQVADEWQLRYDYVAAWITLTVHSSLSAVGLTAAFGKALAEAGISCNVVAAFYHDHIFVDVKDAEQAIVVLKKLSQD